MPQDPAPSPALQRITADGLDPRLARTLNLCRRRWRARSVFEGLVASAAVLLTVLLAALAFGRSLSDAPETTRWLLFGAVTGLTACAVVLRVIWPLVRAVSVRSIAAAIETRCPEARGMLLSAVELGAIEDEAARDSLAMRREVQRRAGDVAETVVPSEVYPSFETATRRFLKPLGILVAAHVVLAFLPGVHYFDMVKAVFLPAASPPAPVGWIELDSPDGFVVRGDDVTVVARVFNDRSSAVQLHQEKGSGDTASHSISTAMVEREAAVFHAEVRSIDESVVIHASAGALRSERQSIRVADPPVVVSFKKRIRPPEYLQGEPRMFEESHGDLRALEGSSVDLEIQTTQELAAAHLELERDGESAQRLPLAVNGRVATMTGFDMQESSQYRVVLTSSETELTNRWSPRFEIRVDVDRAPIVEVEGPEDETVVRTDTLLELRVVARDDVGLASLTRSIEVGGADAVESSLERGDDPLEIVQLDRIDLEALSAETGDPIAVAYRVVDLEGNVTHSRQVRVRVYRDDAQLANSGLATHSRNAAKLLKGLHRGAVNLSALWGKKIGVAAQAADKAGAWMSVRERVQSWSIDAEGCLEELEQALSQTSDTVTRADLWRAHAKLAVSLEYQARLVDALFAELKDPQEGPPLEQDIPQVAFELWAQLRVTLESVARDFTAFLVDREFVLGVHDKLARISKRIEIGNRRPAGAIMDLRGTVFELHSYLESAIDFPVELIDAPRDRKSIKNIQIECQRLAESLEEMAQSADLPDRTILALDVRQTLTGMTRVVGRIRKETAAIRKKQNAWPEVREGAAMADFFERARQRVPAWKTVLLRSSRHLAADPSASPDALLPLLNGLLQARDVRQRDSGWNWRIGIFRQRASWLRRAVEAQEVLGSRYSNDLFVLDRVLESMERRSEDLTLAKFVRAVRDQDRDAVLRALDPLIDDRTHRDPILEQFGQAAAAIRVLELSRDLGNVHSQAVELLDLQARRIAEAALPTPRERRLLEYLLESLEGLVKEATELQVMDFAEAVQRIEQSIETGILRRSMRLADKSATEAPERTLRVRKALVRLEDRLAVLAAKETPTIVAARKALQAMLDDGVNDLDEIVRLAAKSHRDTQALRDDLAGDRTEEELSRLHDLEARVERGVAQLREAYIREAASFDLANSESLKRARDLDAAALALEEASPPISDILLAAAAHEEFRQSALDRVLPRQKKRLEILSKLREHFAREPESGGPDGDLASDLEVDDELDRRYREVQSIQDMKSEQDSLTDRTEELNEADDEDLDRLNRKQKELQERVAEMLERSREGQDALDDLHDRSLETLRAEVDVHHGMQVELDEKRQQEAVELRAGQSRIRAGIESLEREVAEIREEDLDRLERLLRRDTPEQVEGVREARELLQGIEEDLRAAKGEAVDQPDTALEKLKRAERDLASARAHVDRTLEQIDPLEETVKTTTDETEEHRDRIRAVREVDAIRHRERSLARSDELRSSRRLLEDRNALDRQEELRQQLVRIERRMHDRNNREEDNKATRKKLQRDHQATELELERLERVREQVHDDRASEDALAVKDRERLARKILAVARQLLSIADKAGKGGSSRDDFMSARARLTRAAQRLERDPRTRVHSDLDDALAALGADRGSASERVDATAMSRDLIHELHVRGRKLRQQLGGLEERERQSRKDLVDDESALRIGVQESHQRLERIEEVRKLDAQPEGPQKDPRLDAVKKRFTEEVIPAADRMVEWLGREDNRLHAKNSPHVQPSEDDPGRQLAGALDRLRRSLRNSGLERSGRRKPGSGRRNTEQARPGRASAKELSEALDRMNRATGELSKKQPRQATNQQRAATAALDRAMRAAARDMNRQRAPASSQQRPENTASPRENSNVANQDTQQASTNDGALDPELLEAFFGKSERETRQWYLLPSDLKREILMGKRENIPPRYRERVEAYYRRVAESVEDRQ